MSKFSLFKELVDFFSFKARRLILLALVAASVAGTFYWHWPAIARSLFAFGYVALIVLAIESQAGYFVDFTKAALGHSCLAEGTSRSRYQVRESMLLQERWVFSERSKSTLLTIL